MPNAVLARSATETPPDAAPASRATATADGTLVVDARAIDASGIGRYLRELLAHWFVEPPFASLVLLGEPRRLRSFVDEQGGQRAARVVEHTGALYSPASQMSWLRRGRRLAGGPGCAFFPHWDAPVVRMPPNAVVTVHDLIPFRVPDAFPLARRLAARPLFRHVVRRAGRVVCVSRATAADLATTHADVATKIVVVSNGVSERFRTPAETSPSPTGRYVLVVGNRKPHKNLGAAVEVLARARRLGHSELTLVVVGRSFGSDELEATADRLGVRGALRTLGEVSDDELRALYAGAVALLFPSRYEGFGLPLVEAMAAGAPVIASATPAVAEAVGNAAPTFAPDDFDGMASRVDALMRSPEVRRVAVDRGRARAGQFSWQRAARETASVLQAVSRSAR